MNEIVDPSGRRFPWGVDMVGAPLAIGDYVAFPQGRGTPGSMGKGVISRMSPKMVVIQRVGERAGTSLRYYADVVRLNDAGRT